MHCAALLITLPLALVLATSQEIRSLVASRDLQVRMSVVRHFIAFDDASMMFENEMHVSIPWPTVLPVPSDPCSPSPCGPNALCRNGACTCASEYRGNPYEGCYPECVQNSDCSYDKACSNNKCADPCTGICGQNAECAVVNHIPTCSCIQNYEGDSFTLCKPVRSECH